MEKHEETLCEANSKDYSMSFKLQIVQEIERGQLTVTESTKTYGIQNRSTVVKWLRKIGNFDWENQTPFTMSKSPEQRDNGT
jgi:transposase-like protein